jgi:hypothetical protein
MTLDELVARERVRDTYARYNHSGDRGRLDDLAACFTEDGTLEFKGRFTAQGRSAIAVTLADVSSGWSGCSQSRGSASSGKSSMPTGVRTWLGIPTIACCRGGSRR